MATGGVLPFTVEMEYVPSGVFAFGPVESPPQAMAKASTATVATTPNERPHRIVQRGSLGLHAVASFIASTYACSRLCSTGHRRFLWLRQLADTADVHQQDRRRVHRRRGVQPELRTNQSRRHRALQHRARL